MYVINGYAGDNRQCVLCCWVGVARDGGEESEQSAGTDQRLFGRRA